MNDEQYTMVLFHTEDAMTTFAADTGNVWKTGFAKHIALYEGEHDDGPPY